MPNPRISCAKILQAVIEDKIFFGELKKQSSEKDLPFINMLALTTLRNWKALHLVLESYLAKKIPHKHRLAHYLLLAAVAEILFMNTPPYAILNETVDNIRKTTDRFLAGAANAILRKILQDKESLLQRVAQINPLPDTFLPVLDGYTAEEIAYIAESIRRIPGLDITVKNAPEIWRDNLAATLLPNGSLRLFDAPRVQALSGYNSGQWWVQDAAASLPVQVMGNIAGLKVIDLCAAPGGKTAQLAAGGADVTALDISETRLETLRQNMARLGFDNVKTLAVDALSFLQNSGEMFDAVLLDAPCSATGTFRRHPEVLYIKNQDDVAAQVTLQRQLLDACKNILKPGGILVYSVCSISKAEGELQISDFLAANPAFSVIPIQPDDISRYGNWHDSMITPQGYIRTLPYYEAAHNGMDSFFICKMKRII